jgi:hypothetical protein
LSNIFTGFGLTARLSPQTATILRHLLRVGEISGVEAQAMYKARSLTKRISEINEFFLVESEWKRDTTGQRYVRYFMPDDVRNYVREQTFAAAA